MRSQRILLIDDDPFVERTVEYLLADYGFDHHAAQDGSKGLTLARQILPDLILLDVQMPELNGFEVCAQLKADPSTAGIPVIMFTSCAGIEDKTRGFQLGAVDYITKPVEHDELLARITVHLNHRRLYLNLLQRLAHYRERFGDASDTHISETSESSELPEPRLNRVCQAREILERRVAAPPSLEDLARAVGTNAKRLSKDFQILHGMTVFAWLREYRLRQAADLLRASSLSISEIADHLGFSSGPNFSTLFKDRFQITPRQYRTSSEV